MQGGEILLCMLIYHNNLGSSLPFGSNVNLRLLEFGFNIPGSFEDEIGILIYIFQLDYRVQIPSFKCIISFKKTVFIYHGESKYYSKMVRT